MKSIRVRHLNGIRARNLALPNNRSLLDIRWFFTLKSINNDILGAYYKSPILHQSSLNPKWEDLDLRSCNPGELVSKFFIIAIYYLYNDQNYMILEWEVDLDDLCFIGPTLPHFKMGVKLQNVLVFEFEHNFYTTKDMFEHLSEHPSTPLLSFAKQPSDIFEESGQMNSIHSSQRRAYTLQSMQRLLTGVQAFNQYSKRVASASEGGAIAEQQRWAQRQAAAKFTERKVVVSIMATEVERLRNEVQNVQKQLENIRKEVAERKKAIGLCKTEAMESTVVLEKSRQRRSNLHKELEQAASGLNLRRRQLANELTEILPITSVQIQDGPLRNFFISAVHLPRTDRLQEASEASTAAALGLTAILVDRLAQLCDLPLRYPLYPYGSKSRVHDPLHIELPENERIFPLYAKRQEKYHFKYACFLLNKDIQQLRWGCGLDTVDLRATLPNMLDLHARKFQSSRVSAPLPLQAQDGEPSHDDAESDLDPSELSTVAKIDNEQEQC